MNEFVSAGLIGVSLGAQYALLALGFTLIFGILGVVNFAHGGFYVLGGYVAYGFVSHLGVPYVLAVVLATLVTGALGYLFELFIIERIVEDHLATLMLTLGLYLMMSTGVLVTFGPESPQFQFPISGTLRLGAFHLPIENIVVLAICLLAIAVVYLLIYRTDFGRALRALADDRQVAAAQGLRPRAAVSPGLRRRLRTSRPDRSAGDPDPVACAACRRTRARDIVPDRDPRRTRQHRRRDHRRLPGRSRRGLFERLSRRIERGAGTFRPGFDRPRRASLRAVRP